MTKLTPGVHDVMPCQSSVGSCVTHDAGHALLPLQARAANATPSRWRDSIVTAIESDGWVTLESVDDGTAFRVWNHAELGTLVRLGEPVALHGLYHALAVGIRRFNVVVTAV